MKSARQAFTLTEILISLAIIATLVLIPVFAYATTFKNQRDIKRKKDINEIQAALEQYKGTKGIYPDESIWIQELIDNNFIDKIPTDPLEGKQNGEGMVYTYSYSSDGSTYQLTSLLENTEKRGSTSYANEYSWMVARPAGPMVINITPGGPGGGGYPSPTPRSTALISLFPTITLRPTSSPSVSVSNSPTPAGGSPATPTPTPVIVPILDNGNVGKGLDMVIGPNGFPLLAYYDDDDKKVKSFSCGNSGCTSGNTTTFQSIAYTGTNVPAYMDRVALATMVNGNPIIAHSYGAATDILRFTRCTNQSCGTSTTDMDLDSQASSGFFVTSTYTNTVKPFFAHYSDLTGLRLVTCNNADCSVIVRTTYGAGSHYEGLAAAMASDGFPVIAAAKKASVAAGANTTLVLIKCSNEDCSSASETTLYNASPRVGLFPSIVVPADGRPIIASYNETSGDLLYTRCGDQNCSTGNTNTALHTFNDMGAYTSMALGNDGFPVITFIEINSGTPANPTGSTGYVTKCQNITCTSRQTQSLSTNTSYNKVIVPGDGLPVIAHYAFTSGTIRFLKCPNTSCIY